MPSGQSEEAWATEIASESSARILRSTGLKLATTPLMLGQSDEPRERQHLVAASRYYIPWKEGAERGGAVSIRAAKSKAVSILSNNIGFPPSIYQRGIAHSRDTAVGSTCHSCPFRVWKRRRRCQPSVTSFLRSRTPQTRTTCGCDAFPPNAKEGTARREVSKPSINLRGADSSRVSHLSIYEGGVQKMTIEFVSSRKHSGPHASSKSLQKCLVLRELSYSKIPPTPSNRHRPLSPRPSSHTLRRIHGELVACTRLQRLDKPRRKHCRRHGKYGNGNDSDAARN